MYKKILLAYDGSAEGQRALLDSQELAQWSHARMWLIAVVAPPPVSIAADVWAYGPEDPDAERTRVEGVLDAGVQRLRAAGIDAQGKVATGFAVDEIVRAAQDVGADLVVVGHKHLSSWAARWWRGSVSSSLIEHSGCSVLVVITP
jgi:nucleotide-binding universal stress UspA family protein